MSHINLILGNTNCFKNGRGVLVGFSDKHLSLCNQGPTLLGIWSKFTWPDCAVKAFSQGKQTSQCHLLLWRQRYV